MTQGYGPQEPTEGERFRQDAGYGEQHDQANDPGQAAQNQFPPQQPSPQQQPWQQPEPLQPHESASAQPGNPYDYASDQQSGSSSGSHGPGAPYGSAPEGSTPAYGSTPSYGAAPSYGSAPDGSAPTSGSPASQGSAAGQAGPSASAPFGQPSPYSAPAPSQPGSTQAPTSGLAPTPGGAPAPGNADAPGYAAVPGGAPASAVAPTYAPAAGPGSMRLVRTFGIGVIIIGALFMVIRAVAMILSSIGGYAAGYSQSEAGAAGVLLGGLALVLINILVGIVLLAAAIYFLVVGPKRVRIAGGLILAPVLLGVITRLIISGVAQAAVTASIDNGDVDTASGVFIALIIVEILRHVIEGAFVIAGGVLAVRAAKSAS
jgi:hypothetical protein